MQAEPKSSQVAARASERPYPLYLYFLGRMIAYPEYRIRKIKCDEAQPSCNRCTSTGRICDGYGIWSSGRDADSRRSIRPKAHDDVALHPVYFTALAASEEERSCFEWFKCRTTKKVQGAFIWYFWDTLVVQVSSSEPAVLHAALALSSVHRLNGVEDTIRNVKIRDSIPDKQEEFTLRQYTKAIGHLQPHFSAKDMASIRVALITCALFICLDLFRGHYTTALAHLHSGLKLLRNIRNYSGMWDEGLMVPTSSGEPIDDWIAETFFRLHLQARLFNQGSSYPRVLLKPVEYEVMPIKFQSMYQARKHLDRLLEEIVYLTERGKLQGWSTDEMTRPEIVDRQSFLQETLTSWFDIYKASRASLIAEFDGPVHGKFVYDLLHLYHIMAIIMAHACLWPTCESIFDLHADNFMSMITIAITLRRAPSSDSNGMSRSVADMAWIPPLYYIAIKCRIHRIRLHAIKLLRSSSHKEGIWDGAISACIAQKVMETEERDFYKDATNADDFDIRKPPEEQNLLLRALPKSYRVHDVQVLLPNDPLQNIILSCRRRKENRSLTILIAEYDALSECWIAEKEETQ